MEVTPQNCEKLAEKGTLPWEEMVKLEDDDTLTLVVEGGLLLPVCVIGICLNSVR